MTDRSEDEIVSEIAEISIIKQQVNARLVRVSAEKDRLIREANDRGERVREVTDHAVIRYLQRWMGVNIEEIREKIRIMANESEVVKSDIDARYFHPTGTLLITNDRGAVVTVLSPEDLEKYIGRKLMNGERIPERTHEDSPIPQSVDNAIRRALKHPPLSLRKNET